MGHRISCGHRKSSAYSPSGILNLKKGNLNKDDSGSQPTDEHVYENDSCTLHCSNWYSFLYGFETSAPDSVDALLTYFTACSLPLHLELMPEVM